jgi:hypothetical protein
MSRLRAGSGHLPDAEISSPVEQLLPLVDPQVNDTVYQLVNYGMHFFEEFTRNS